MWIDADNHPAPQRIDPVERRAWQLYCAEMRTSVAQPDDWPGHHTRAYWMMIAMGEQADL